MKSKVLIVDDHPMVCEALSTRISLVPNLEVCGQADSQQQAMDLVEELSPDVVLIDISLKSGNGIELVKQIHSKFSRVKMLVISAFPETLYAERAMRAGALGYLNKQETSENVITAIQTVLDGKLFVSQEMTQQLLKNALNNAESALSPVAKLSNRELEVFHLIGLGLKSSAIALRMDLSVHTIDTYREKIKPKIGAKNGTELQREAVRWVMQTEQSE